MDKKLPQIYYKIPFTYFRICGKIEIEDINPMGERIMDKLFEPVTLVTKRISVDSTTRNTIDLYRQNKIPLSMLITDCSIIMNHRTLLSKDNPWVYYHKGIMKQSIESGASVVEDAFNLGAILVAKKTKPTGLINAVFYANKKRNDSAFELSFLLPYFLEEFPASNILIVNPSPDIIRFVEERHDGPACYLVTDETIAGLYQKEFPRSSFGAFDQYSQFEEIDAMLVVNRDQEKNNAELLLSGLSCCSEDAEVLLCCPSVWFDSSDRAAILITEKGFSVESAVILDTAATVSTPRKKVLVHLNRRMNKTVSLYKSLYEKTSKEFCVLPEKKDIDEKVFLSSSKSINSLWKNDVKEMPVKSIKNEKASEYRYSEEIRLFYNIYSDRKKRFCGTAYYRRIIGTEPLRFGGNASKRIEKGLRGKSVEEIKTSLEEVPLYENLSPIICDDLTENYGDKKSSLSFKSLWFLLRKELQLVGKYDEETIKTLFPQGNAAVADYHPGSEDIQIVLASIAGVLSVDVEDIPFKVVDQLDLILDTAVKFGFINRNRLKSYLPGYTQRATQRQQEIRQALVKKHLTAAEENRILSFLFEETEADRVKAPRVVLQSVWLAGLIRLFTGMAAREVCALLWRDYQNIEDTDDYVLAVSKIVNDDGKLQSHAERSKWNRFRIIPVTRILKQILEKRKEYLHALGIGPEDLDKTPMILNDEKYDELRLGRIVPFCKPKKISKVCRDLIDVAAIPSELIVLPDEKNEMRTDIYKYLGDLFLSNFSTKAKNVAGFTLGELNYTVGIEAPDTFSKHYCDYSNDFIQYGMIQKLERWTTVYRSLIDPLPNGHPSVFEKNGSFQIKAGPFAGESTAIEMIIRNRSEKTATVKIDVAHGASVEVCEFGGKTDVATE